jgi:diguanylate cyclase (GGDEF)-like protein/PAS domain S-box-containing protein
MFNDHLKAAAEELPGLLYRRQAGAAAQPVFLAGPVAELTGWPAEAMGRDMSWSGLIHGEDRARVSGETRRAIAAGGEYAITYRIVTRGGGVRWVSDRGRAFFAEAQGPPILTGIILDITRQRDAEERARWIANHDSLTLLANRPLFLEELDQRLARDEAAPFALLLIDVDGLRRINDLQGHPEGDRLLCAMAGILSKAAHPGDFVARLSGDEFACILSGVGAREELRERCSALQTLVAAGLSCRATIGAALFPNDGWSREELLRHADMALGDAKEAARGGFRIFEPEMRSRIQRHASMLSLGRQALKAGRIHPFYQPKVDLRTNAVTGFEALLRWRHTSGGPRLPSDIQACFEEPEMAIELTDAMLGHVLADVKRWTELGIRFGHVAINVCTFDFSRRDFAHYLLRRLAESSLQPALFQVEVTETVMVGHHAAEVERALRRLSAAGISIALDDFGTGFASLTHLCRFPADVLKIDRSFVQAEEDERGAAAIVGSMIGLAHTLGIKAVAEGVETDAQKQKLISQGCDEGQGYLYSKPVSSDLVPGLLTRLGQVPQLAA